MTQFSPNRKAIIKTFLTLHPITHYLLDHFMQITMYVCFSISFFPIRYRSSLGKKLDTCRLNKSISSACRMTHPGQGIPSALIQDMFEGGNQWTRQEGFGLNLSRKLLDRMNGRVHYVREHDKCYFLIDLELKTKN